MIKSSMKQPSNHNYTQTMLTVLGMVWYDILEFNVPLDTV